MGLCMSMPSSNSKVNPSSETLDISMSLPQFHQDISIRTFIYLNQRHMSKHTSTKTETF
uniref:AC4 n=1 Tax=Tomato leaf curl New Delhi virus TaxID=223347 RepID=A0A2K8HQ05_9GEMI|nr:AC4 [Tomato leaf curl New Delhi virus]WIM64364.1 C4 [Tomato leaf curl New Delhi virus]